MSEESKATPPSQQTFKQIIGVSGDEKKGFTVPPPPPQAKPVSITSQNHPMPRPASEGLLVPPSPQAAKPASTPADGNSPQPPTASPGSSGGSTDTDGRK